MSDAARFAALQRERFRELGRVEASIVTDWPAAWAPDRRYLLFLAAVGDQDDVRAAAARALAAIAGPGVPPLDPRRLHITIQAVGYADELPSRVEVDLIREARASVADAEPAELSIVGAGSFADAAVLWLDPWDPLIAIRDRLLDGVARLTPASAGTARPPEEGGFAPHISIAYYDEPVPTGPIADAIEALAPATARCSIETVQLVSVPPPIGAQVGWDVLASFPLGSPA